MTSNTRNPLLWNPFFVKKEICICAAWKAKNEKTYRGHRHIHCLDAMGDENTEPLTKGDMGQGFITSKNRFVNRKEGYELQMDAGVESVAKGGYRDNRLFSEDLY